MDFDTIKPEGLEETKNLLKPDLGLAGDDEDELQDVDNNKNQENEANVEDEEDEVDSVLDEQQMNKRIEFNEDEIDFTKIVPETVVVVNKDSILDFKTSIQDKVKIKSLYACCECGFIQPKETWNKVKTCRNCKVEIATRGKITRNFYGMTAFNDLTASSYILRVFRMVSKRTVNVPGFYAITMDDKREDDDEN